MVRITTIPSRARAWLARQLEKLQKTVAPPLPPPAPESECDACANNTHPIASPDHDARVLAFGGGGYDTVMQLGVVHALVVRTSFPQISSLDVCGRDKRRGARRSDEGG